MDRRLVHRLRARLDDEVGPGTHVAHAPLRMSLCYPSPYNVAMSSLGYLQVHRLANQRPGTMCERAVLPDSEDLEHHRRTRTPLLTLESQRPASDAHIIGVSHAYELELIGLVQLFELMGMEPLAKDRSKNDPLVVVGGPITFSNPLPTSAFADIVLLGEAEETLGILLEKLEEDPGAARGDAQARQRLLEDMAGVPGVYVPRLHGRHLPAVGQAPDELLPAVSEIRTPHTELSNMVLIEPERGCHRGCTFCVMRRSTNGGMRWLQPERVQALIPDDTPKVGLVGAAVTDHPRIKQILRTLVDEREKRIGISSLRADRLDAEFVGLLARGGYRSMTVALDAASVRLRDSIEKNIKDRHIERAVNLAKAEGMRHLKMYCIVGLPDETEEDLEELVQFMLQLRKTLPVVLGLSPFVPKFHTPLAAAPFAGEAAINRTLKSMHRRLAKHGIQMRGPGAREAWVEYRLAQGGPEHAVAAIQAARAGGSLADWKRALKPLPERYTPDNLADLIPAPTRRRLRIA